MSRLFKLFTAALAACLAAGALLIPGCSGKQGISGATQPPEPTAAASELPTAAPTSVPVPPGPQAPAFAVYRAPAGGNKLRVMLSEAAEQEVKSVLAGREWSSGADLDGAQPDYRIFEDGKEYSYSSVSGVLADAAAESGSSLTDGERQTLNTLFGVGAVRGSSVPEGCGITGAAIARLDTSGENASVIIEFYNDTDDYAGCPFFFRVFYMEGETPEDVGCAGEQAYYVSIPTGVTPHTFELSACELSRPGLYRICFYPEELICPEESATAPVSFLPSDHWLEFEVSENAPEPPELDEDELCLREKYPYYFDLDTTEGLDVYVWQMARNSWSFAFLPGREEPRDWQENFEAIEGASIRDGHRSVTVETARKILACYGLPRESVRIVPYQNTLSSYMMPTGPVFMAQLEALLFGEG